MSQVQTPYFRQILICNSMENSSLAGYTAKNSATRSTTALAAESRSSKSSKRDGTNASKREIDRLDESVEG